MTAGSADADLYPAEPIERPGVRHFLWYVLGGSVPARNRTWVLHDTTCPTWAIREIGRPLAVIAPLLLAYLAFVPGTLGLRLITGLTFAGGGLLFMFVNALVDNDRRAVRAGYPSGFVADLRSRRGVEKHRLMVAERRARIAARAARRNEPAGS
jgi:hypothetical protein